MKNKCLHGFRRNNVFLLPTNSLLFKFGKVEIYMKIRELVQSLDKVTLLSKHSVKSRHCILCGDVTACHEMACVLFVVQTLQSLHNI